MPNSTERFEWLTQQLDPLAQGLHIARTLDERRLLLRRMKVLIVEIDMLILSDLERDRQDITNLSPPDQPTAKS
jgi:hypothetical protein